MTQLIATNKCPGSTEYTKRYELINEERFDMIIIDIGLPGMDGLSLMKKVKRLRPNLPILILSMYLGRALAKKILSAAADGHLSKKANKKELFKAIEKFATGGTCYGNEITSIMADLINCKTSHTSVAKKEFTKREREVLRLICQEYSSKEIADRLCIGVTTVETHRRSMLQKTNSKNVIGLIRFAVQNELALWH
ncbi:response regulator [Sungkyunkwania multivorans]|uniref:Response regulator n=1 Tax=Sungkyunkwania multivorans TaxID=1173618 RepID=A0ABW3CXX2_9FLAO